MKQIVYLGILFLSPTANGRGEGWIAEDQSSDTEPPEGAKDRWLFKEVHRRNVRADAPKPAQRVQRVDTDHERVPHFLLGHLRCKSVDNSTPIGLNVGQDRCAAAQAIEGEG